MKGVPRNCFDSYNEIYNNAFLWKQKEIYCIGISLFNKQSHIFPTGKVGSKYDKSIYKIEFHNDAEIIDFVSILKNVFQFYKYSNK